MSLSSTTDFILKNRWRTLAVAFAITFIPLIGTISIIIAGLVTLRKGALEGFWVLIASTLRYFLILPVEPMPTSLWLVGVITATNLLTWGFAALLHRFQNWNLVLEVAALIGIVIVTTAHAVKPDIETFWGNQLSTLLSQADAKASLPSIAQNINKSSTAPAATPAAQPSEEGTEPDIISFVNVTKPYATGILAASLVFTALMQLLIARFWQLVPFKPLEFQDEIHHVRLSHMAGLVFLAALVLSYLKIALALDMLPVLYLTFCIAGLSLAHYFIAKLKILGWLWLFVFYTILLCSWMVYHSPLAFQLIALIALLDVWFDWRERNFHF